MSPSVLYLIEEMAKNTKVWLRLLVVAVFVGLLYAWASGTFRFTEVDSTTSYVSQAVPAPGPGQKKVVLQNLGMV